MVITYQKRPSELLSVTDEYVAYCLDEAITEFIMRTEKGEKPRFKTEKDKRNKSYNPGLKLLLG
ncbi:hypothetical protein [Clostridium algidicarnis]|uniref:hypothetical protein n=1 Tax=Clostridium algidicarnis TaxID=37659 RepID=UPI001C0B8BC8|nr:hypothetical protein [Clostridium algidicarnis]MBU3195644.1 hypothetical protein [Clostridium algidicarnis]